MLLCEKWQQRDSLTKLVFDMEEHLKQRCGTKFFHVKKTAHTDVYWCLQNIYGEQTVDVSTVI